jgi:hypothetical protein
MRTQGFILVPGMAFLVLLFQGCALNQSGYYDSQGVYHVYSETSNSTTPVSTPTSTPSGGGSAYPFTAAVGATGYNATYITVKTGKVLKVQFAPGVQNKPVSGTGFYPQYSKLGVYITVGSSSKATALLANGYNSAQQSSLVMDYSDQTPCTKSNGSSSCRQNVMIIIERPNNDYKCLNYGTYCPYDKVYETHPWNGTLTIQTDDTTEITL